MDNLILYGPVFPGTATGASPVNVGTWLRADPGPDFGSRDLEQRLYAQNPLIPGGRPVLEYTGIRRMAFPLLLASGGAGLPLRALESLLRLNARPGGYLDVQPQGVPSAEAVRFDIVGGRYESDYHVRLNEIGRAFGTLHLDVQPFGYWPTWITLASAASVGLPGMLVVPRASILGDAVGDGRLIVMATAATGYPAGSWLPDLVGWSLAGGPSHAALWGGGSITGLITATQVGVPVAPAATVTTLFPSPTQAGWTQIARALITQAEEPRYRGRHRMFAWLRLGPSQAEPWQITGDAAPGRNAYVAMASAQRVATLAPAVATGTPGLYGAQPSPAFTLVDLGEVTVPALASGAVDRVALRLWAAPATSNVGVATPILDVGGLYLLPLNGPAGVLPRGLVQPTIMAASEIGVLHLESANRRRLISNPPFSINPDPLVSADLYHRGGYPHVGASTVQVDILVAARKVASGATAPAAHTGPFYGKVALAYQPRFTFLKGL